MKTLILKNTAFGLALIVLIGGLSQCSQSAYAAHAHPHGELILAGHLVTGAQPPKRFFLCVTSAYARFMAWQEGTRSRVPESSYSGLPTPFVLPPSFGSEWQDSNLSNWSQS